ncbi:hypothetical protein WA171_005409 [Blastocystis sp. BT1]
MSIRIAINSDVRIHNCWEWEHMPIWWSWKVKNLRINDCTCYYTPWVRSFDLSRYKNLKTLDVGEWCFRYVKRVKISGLNQLESVSISYSSLMNPSSIRFENLPKLKSIKLGYYALCGSYGTNDNSLRMKNLPSLSYLYGSDHNFSNMHNVILESI